MSSDDSALEREFDTLMAKADVRVPEDLKGGVLAGYRDFRRLTPLLRQPRTAANEPSNTFSLTAYLKRG